MARNMHGVGEDDATVQRIAEQAGCGAHFVVMVIEYYTDHMAGTTLEKADDDDERVGVIVMLAMVGAFGYNEQDDDADWDNTNKLRAWARTV